MKYKYNVGDLIKIKFHNEIKHAVITMHNVLIGSPAYGYIVQGIQSKPFWDTEYNLELRISAANEQQDDMVKQTT
jgi:hypothetical protein